MYLNLPGHLPATYCPMYGSLSSAINERKLCCHTDHSFTAHSILGALPAACFSLKCTETALVVIGGLLILNPMKIVFSEFTELLCCFWERAWILNKTSVKAWYIHRGEWKRMIVFTSHWNKDTNFLGKQPAWLGNILQKSLSFHNHK